MIKYNCRFCPTVSGWLHLGHLYMCLVNIAEAQRTGGQFIVRWDDTQRIWNRKFTQHQLMELKLTMQIDLKWAGVDPDRWSAQSDLMQQALDLAHYLDYDLPDDTYDDLQTVEVIGDAAPYYPANERLTAEHVLMDHIEGVNLVIRGRDLITEANAYLILAHQLGFARTRHIYIPRLDFPGDVVSKTAGNFKLKDYRAAEIDPDEIIIRLACDCLKDAGGGWFADNVKSRPVLGEWAKRILCHS
jgi:glutamyl/glutaminyl-tRNA synthetase